MANPVKLSDSPNKSVKVHALHNPSLLSIFIVVFLACSLALHLHPYLESYLQHIQMIMMQKWTQLGILDDHPGLGSVFKSSTSNPSHEIISFSPVCSQKRFILQNMISYETCQNLVDYAKHLFIREKVGSELYGVNLEQVYHDPELSQDILHALNETRYKIYEQVKQRLPTSETFRIGYTHITERKATQGIDFFFNIVYYLFSQGEMSHGWHADDCEYNEITGDCKPVDYLWYTHSALLYLNDHDVDYTGGEFVFDNNRSIPPEPEDGCGVLVTDNHGRKSRTQDIIHPTCGTLVGFTSGPENIHAVTAVKSGVRYAIAVWFTERTDRGESLFLDASRLQHHNQHTEL